MPARRYMELRRRRRLKRKVAKLRERCRKAKSQADKDKAVEKALRSAPSMTREQFLAKV